MINKITIERSLMYVQQHHIDTFVEIHGGMSKFWYIIEKHEANAEDDVWNLVFNVWVLLMPDKSKVIQSVEKSLYYSANYVVLEALMSDANFQNLKKRSNGNETLNFLSAVMIASGIWTWILNVLEKYSLTDIAERNKKRVFHESHKRAESEIEIHLQDQARLTKAVVKELSTNSFKEKIKKCCNDVYELC